MPVIDLSSFKGLPFRNLNAVLLDTGMTFDKNADSSNSYRLSSLTADDCYFYLNIPGPLPVGTKLTAVIETKSVSGGRPTLGFRSFPDSIYGGEFVLTGVAENEVTTNDSSEFSTIRTSVVIGPLRQYYQLFFGYIAGSIGVDDIRSLRLIYENCDDAVIRPNLTNSALESGQSYYDLKRNWVADAVGIGNTVTFSDASSSVLITSNNPGAGPALLHDSRSTDINDRLNRGLELASCDCIEVALDCNRGFGNPCLIVEQYDVTSFVTRSMLLITGTTTRQKHKFVVPRAEGATKATLSIGFDQANQGSLVLFGLTTRVYGSVLPPPATHYTFAATLKKDGATWAIDDVTTPSETRYRALRINSLTQNALDLVLNFEGVPNNPHFVATMDLVGGGALSHRVACSAAFGGQVSLNFINQSTDTVVSVVALPDDSVVTIIGVAAV